MAGPPSGSFIRFLLGPDGSAQPGIALLRSVRAHFGWSTIQAKRYIDFRFRKVWSELDADVSAAMAGQTRSFLRDDRNLSTEDAKHLLGYVRSHLIAKFQGTYMELLAQGTADAVRDELASTLGVDLDAWSGSDVTVPVSTKSQRIDRYDQGPDLVWVATRSPARALLENYGRWLAEIPPEPLVVIGIGEIKSYHRVSMTAATAQLVSHARRLSAGARHGPTPYDSKAISFLLEDGQRPIVVPVEKLPAQVALAPRFFLFRPRTDRLPTEHPACALRSGVHVVDLPVANSQIADIGHALSVHFLEGLAERIGREGLACPPYLALEEHVREAMIRGLYYLTDRDDLPARQFHVAQRLYNYYSYGFTAARRADSLLYPQDVDPRNTYLRIVVPSGVDPRPYLETARVRSAEVRLGRYREIRLCVWEPQAGLVERLVREAQCEDACRVLPYQDSVAGQFPPNFVVTVTDVLADLRHPQLP